MTPRFHPLHSDIERPPMFNDPFDYEPHPLCTMAVEHVRAYIHQVEPWQADLAAGKMLGVLVCQQQDGQLGFLAAYSGLLAGRNDWDYFVPPVFDAQQPDGHFKTTERAITAINDEVRQLSAITHDATPSPLSANAGRLTALKCLRKQMSEDLQLWLFRQYRVLNARGEEKDLADLWCEYHRSERVRQKFPLPPGGTGDCCAPKLLQYAYQQGLQPLAIAEFWQGASPRGEIRHHGHYYPACRGKCKPVLQFMLEGLNVEHAKPAVSALPTIIHEESTFVVISKPAGLLSVPGRTEQPSVESLLRERYPAAEGPMMVHRLDQDTSGLMVIALTLEAYRDLQQQFLQRTVKKRYVALLCPPAQSNVLHLKHRPQGRIALPLRPDPLDRPRQVVDTGHGKPAITDYELLSADAPHPRIVLTPHTGRTHQLRMHCAHPDGLGCPILGDALYGQKADRLYLHAEWLQFCHPVTGQQLQFSDPAPF